MYWRPFGHPSKKKTIPISSKCRLYIIISYLQSSKLLLELFILFSIYYLYYFLSIIIKQPATLIQNIMSLVPFFVSEKGEQNLLFQRRNQTERRSLEGEPGMYFIFLIEEIFKYQLLKKQRSFEPHKVLSRTNFHKRQFPERLIFLRNLQKVKTGHMNQKSTILVTFTKTTFSSPVTLFKLILTNFLLILTIPVIFW